MKKLFRKIFLLQILVVCLSFNIHADNDTSDTIQTPTFRVSLLTAEPGPEIFELYGHQAVRVQSLQGVDITYNFGLFDFNHPNFVYRFLKGKTDYMAGAFPTAMFLDSYVERGSRVTEQVLNLTPQEARRMVQMLDEAVMPQNTTYRYRYCTNNCATRVLDILEASLSSPVKYPDTDPQLNTYRKVMRKYDSNYPWYQMGIDIALGSSIDTIIGARERMFVPMQLQKTMTNTMLKDGRNLVSETNILVEGRGDITLPDTKFLFSPLFYAIFILTITLLNSYLVLRKRNSRNHWWTKFLWIATGIAGLLSWFLIFISEHEGTSPNIIGLWLNPFWLLPVITDSLRKLRSITRFILIPLITANAALLFITPFSLDKLDTPLIIMSITTLMVSIVYMLSINKRNENRIANTKKE